MKSRIMSLFFGIILCTGIILSTAATESEKLFIVQTKASLTDNLKAVPLRNTSNFDGDDRMIIGREISKGINFGAFVRPSFTSHGIGYGDRDIKMTPRV